LYQIYYNNKICEVLEFYTEWYPVVLSKREDLKNNLWIFPYFVQEPKHNLKKITQGVGFPRVYGMDEESQILDMWERITTKTEKK